MGDLREIEANEVKRVKQMSIAFNEDEYLLIFNTKEADIKSGDIFSLPIQSLQKIIHGMIECGKAYQKEYNKSIGVDEE